VTTIGGKRLMFSGLPSGHPCICYHVFHVMQYLFTRRKDFRETWHKRSSGEWPLQKRFYR